MNITKRFTPVVFAGSIAGTLTLRWLALEFLYRLMPEFWTGIVSSLLATGALACIVIFIIALFLRPIEVISKRISQTGEIKETDRNTVIAAYRKVSIAVVIQNVVGFIIGQLLVMVLDVKAGVVPYQLSRLVIIMIQATCVGSIVALYDIYYLDMLFAGCRKILNIHSMDMFGSVKKHSIATRILLVSAVTLFFMGLNAFTCGYALLHGDNITSNTNILGTYLGYGIKCITITFVECFGLIVIVVLEMKQRIAATSRTLSELENSGDLSKRINISMTDDIGNLISNLNGLMDKLSLMIIGLQGETRNVSDSANILTTSSAKSLDALKLMNASVSQIDSQDKITNEIVSKTYSDIQGLKENAHKVEQQVVSQSESLQRASASITQMAGNISSIAETAKKADEISEKLRDTSKQGTEAIKSAEEAILLIQQASKEIQETVGLIQNISSQTNLLSMNASIEAAHAGSFGTGFAVVANEVRTLASTSASNAQTIKKHMQEMSNRINNGVEAMQKAGSSFSLIDTGIEDTANIIQQISHAAEEQSTGANETLKATQDVVNSINSIRDLARSQSEHTSNVAESTKNIVSSSEAISSALKQTAEAVASLNNALINVDQCATQNTASVQKMKVHIDEFKTN